MDQTTLKRLAGIEAAQEVNDGDIVGLGTGSTVEWTIKELGRRIDEDGIKILGIPTSVRSRDLAEQLGIPRTTLDEHPTLDITIDGADEVDRDLDLVKGGGGALTWEKIVAQASRREVIVVDPSKLVDSLAVKFPLPVEVVPLAIPTVKAALAEMGADPQLRRGPDGGDYRTDNGMAILDCRFPDGIDDKAQAETTIDALPGVLECGLFLGLTDLVIVGTTDGPVRLGKGEWL